MSKRQILLTNDDGIRSPGLWAAAQALSSLGFVTVAAPLEQSSGMGRSLPGASDGVICPVQVQVNGQEWTAYAVSGSPAQAVQHAILEIMSACPDLVVSGINYGENVGTGITISGTVGAAMEAASMRIPSLAVSLETEQEHHLSYSTEIDFSASAYFTAYFARLLLEKRFPDDVHLLKVDVPRAATIHTPWQLTRLSPQRYYEPVAPERSSWREQGKVGYRNGADLQSEPPGTDVYALRKLGVVSVTPLSLDLTSRVDFAALERWMRDGEEKPSGG